MADDAPRGDDLQQLCEAHGIDTAYEDALGRRHEVPPQALLALLRDAGAFEEAHEPSHLPPLAVVTEGSDGFDLSLGAADVPAQLHWRLLEEEGLVHEGRAGVEAVDGRQHARITVALPWGYHRLQVDGLEGSTLVVCAPERCHEPPVLAKGARLWGVALQLYGLRSARNWGIGDFGDLKDFASAAAREGAAFIGLNPLHALFPGRPDEASPYSPSSRSQLNVLYIDVEAVPDFAECRSAQARVASLAFQQRLAALRDAPLVDYAAVAAAKHEVLALLHAHFRERRDPDDSQVQAFEEYRARHGAALREHALFEALQAHFQEKDATTWGWPAWPEAWRDPRSAEVEAFEREHEAQVQYFEYLQWQAARQLEQAARACRLAGMQIGLYLDLAVSVNRGGADSWRHQRCFAPGASVGAPPDLLNRQGQDWGLPPLRPDRLRQSGHAIFIEALRANMRSAGALRIDHVMMLMRLFWIPAGGSAHEGTYVHYPWQELFAILALESRRHRCMVIGEDLGTVPGEMRAAMRRHGVLSYRLLYFERDAQGAFLPPEAYPREAVVAVSTHDLPTFAGWWSAADIRTQAALGLGPEDVPLEELLARRAREREQLAEALDRPVQAPSPAGEAPPIDLTAAVHAWLGRTASCLMAVQLEDLTGQAEQANLPGTTVQHPNWRRRYEAPLQAIWQGETARAIAWALAGERPRRSAARIPRATYRLQLHKGFDFDDAAAIVPYLAQLGISHVYCSPIHRARPGSLHGYDVVAHDEISPDLGGMAAYVRFCETLRTHGMGQLIDLVPNHMGVLGADNAWWNDVLEKGQASAYAEYFDIDWHSTTPGLAGKVLLPVLGAPYGEVLERGELSVGHDARANRWFARYYEHRFPLAPDSVFPPLREAAARGDGAALAEALESLNSPQHRDTLHALLDSQSWRLAHWRCAADEINYRRFFDVNELAALRTEREDVFRATHAMALELAARGWVDGLRIDHPDGLLDPAAYFERLQAGYAARLDASGGAATPLYVVAEKITAPGEDVPVSWPIHGTTGYRFANVANGVLVDTRGGEALEAIWREFMGQAQDFADVVYRSRHTVATTTLASDLETLANALHRIAKADRRTRDHTLNTLREAVAAVASAMPVYRTYNGDEASAQDVHFVERAIASARERLEVPEPGLWDFMRESLLGRPVAGAAQGLGPAARRFARRFQQYSAPVAAKGVEDTAFYRYFPLSSLNEVGGDPQQIGLSVDAFHAASLDRQRRWPHTMLATSTHDNKRSEDVRLRIDLLSECPWIWRAALQRWRQTNAAWAAHISPAHEYLFYQTVIGALPLRDADGGVFAQRMVDYMRKAAREGKTHTSWTQPEAAYEEALERFVRQVLDKDDAHNAFLPEMREFVRQLDPFAALSSLSLCLLKFTSPGVPDVYQGCEFIEHSLVDPDNRRAVDFDARREALASLQHIAERGSAWQEDLGELLADPGDGRAKLWATWRLLSLRRKLPDLFQYGSYEALEVLGQRAHHVVAYLRRCDEHLAIVIVTRLHLALAMGDGETQEVPAPAWRSATVWGDTRVRLPAAVAVEPMLEWLSGKECVADAELPLAGLLTHFPGAVLVPADAR